MKFNKLLSLILVAIMSFSMLLVGCGKKDDTSEVKNKSNTKTIEVVDQTGRKVKIKSDVKKVVSSYYISTALIIALDADDKLVGIEKAADTRKLYKLAAPELLKLPAVGSGKGINVEEIAKLSPDLVILPLKLKDSVEQLEKLNIPVIVIDPETLDNFYECVTLISKAVGKEKRGEKLLKYYDDKMKEVNSKVLLSSTSPQVYIAAGSDYYSTCTSKMYQDALVSMVCGKNVSHELTDGYWQKISPEQLVKWNPDTIFAVSYAQYKLEDIKNDKKLSQVDAVKNNRVYTFPSAIEPWDYPTPSSILGVMWLASKIQPNFYKYDDFLKEAKAFYKEFFEIEVTEEDMGL